MTYKVIHHVNGMPYFHEKPPECKKCIKEKRNHTIRGDFTKVLTSMPPTYRYECDGCGGIFYMNQFHSDREWEDD